MTGLSSIVRNSTVLPWVIAVLGQVRSAAVARTAESRRVDRLRTTLGDASVVRAATAARRRLRIAVASSRARVVLLASQQYGIRSVVYRWLTDPPDSRDGDGSVRPAVDLRQSVLCRPVVDGVDRVLRARYRSTVADWWKQILGHLRSAPVRSTSVVCLVVLDTVLIGTAATGYRGRRSLLVAAVAVLAATVGTRVQASATALTNGPVERWVTTVLDILLGRRSGDDE